MNWDQRVAPSALRILIKWGAGQSTPANPAGRASIPSLMEKAASNALRERTLRRGEPAHPALRVSTRRLEQLPANPANGAGTLRRALVPAYPVPREPTQMNWDQRVAPSALRVITLIKRDAWTSRPADPAGRASSLLRQGLLHAHPVPRVSIMSGLEQLPADPALQALHNPRQGNLHAQPVLRERTRMVEQLPAHPVLQARSHRQVRRTKVPVKPALKAVTLIRRVVSAKTAVRARLPPLIEKAASNALLERTLRRGETADRALQAPTLSSREPPPAYPAHSAREAFPAAAPA